MCSERVIDTSSLQSTKTIGQRKEAKQTEERRRNAGASEDENLKNSGSKGDERDDDDQFATVQVQTPLPVDLGLSRVGAALKLPSSRSLDEHNPLVRKKRNRQNEPSWRQRLQDIHPTSKIMDNEYPYMEISSPSSENGEYSDWSGISSDDGSAVVDSKDELFESKNVNSHKQLDEAPGTQVAKRKSGAEGERTQQRAKYFKLWAREQSGFNSSKSNISGLPELPLMQREVVAVDPNSQSRPPVPASNDVISQRVHLPMDCA
jgi:hypothetical protein